MSEQKPFVISTSGFRHHGSGLCIQEIAGEEVLKHFHHDKNLKFVSGIEIPVPKEINDIVQARTEEVEQKTKKRNEEWESRANNRVNAEKLAIAELFGK